MTRACCELAVVFKTLSMPAPDNFSLRQSRSSATDVTEIPFPVLNKSSHLSSVLLLLLVVCCLLFLLLLLFVCCFVVCCLLLVVCCLLSVVCCLLLLLVVLLLIIVAVVRNSSLGFAACLLIVWVWSKNNDKTINDSTCLLCPKAHSPMMFVCNRGIAR